MDLRIRVVLSQLPMTVLTAVVALLAWLFIPDLLSDPLFLAGQVLQLVLLAACFLVPWHKLPNPSYWAIPLLDFVVVGLLREGAGGTIAALGVLAVLPVIWLTLSGAAPTMAAVISFAGPLLILVVPMVFTPGPVGAADVAAQVLLPTVLLGVWLSLHTILESMQVQQNRLQAKDAALLHALNESRAKETLLNGITEAIDVGIVAVDEDGHDVLMNRKQRTIHRLGIPPGAEDADESQLLLFDADGSTPLMTDLRPVRRALEGETITELVMRIGEGDRQRAFSVSARKMMTPTGRPAGTVVTFTDVTDLHAALGAKDLFVSSVSHELRTPLTSILGYLDLALDDKEHLPAATAGYLRVAQRNAERLLDLVSDLLTAASGNLHVAPVRTCLADLLRTALASAAPRAEANGLDIVCDVPETVEAVLDPGRMSQVIDNLISNAIKYSPHGGSITVSAWTGPGFAAFSVADTGMGISEAEQAGVFSKFYRAGSALRSGIPGIGLGLAISKNIVDAHDGTIGFRSQLGTGTTFTVTLPSTALDAMVG